MLLPEGVSLNSMGDASPGGITRRSFLKTATIGAQLVAWALFAVISFSDLSAQDLSGPFSGRWDLTLKGTAKDLPSWIEVSEDHGQVKVVLVGPTDHATPLKQAGIKNGELEFVSPKDEEGFDADTTFKAKLVGGRLVGTVTNPDHTWQLVGKRAPAFSQATSPQWGTPVSLFNGKDFTGWRFSDPSKKSSWEVVDGTLVSNGNGSEIISIPTFFDFKLHLEFNAGPQSNSGVYLRGRYEVQIETDSESQPPSHHTGGVYGFLDPIPEQPRKADLWQSFDITFVGRTVTIIQNGVTVIDHKQIPGITGGAVDSNEALPGPIYLQGTEQGRVAFRNILITPAKR
jgi:Domain of Unknown Function (DUF1080)